MVEATAFKNGVLLGLGGPFLAVAFCLLAGKWTKFTHLIDWLPGRNLSAGRLCWVKDSAIIEKMTH